MENGGNADDYGLEFSDVSFWENYSVLKGRINILKRKHTAVGNYNPYQLCTDIEEMILEFDDEPNLSPLQNKVRKLDTSTDLCREVCLLQRHFSNLEINKAVSNLLEVEKYDNIAQRINKWKRMKSQREEFFNKQALNSIKESLENEDQEVGEEEEVGTTTGAASGGTTAKSVTQELRAPTEVTEDIPGQSLESADALSEILRPNPWDSSITGTGRDIPPQSVNVDDENVRFGDVDLEEMGIRDVPVPYGDVTVPEMSQRFMDKSTESMIDLKELEAILENGVSELHGDAELDPVPQGEREMSGMLNNITQEDDLDNLPPVTATPRRRRRRLPPTFDNSIIIPNYTERARRLNRSVVVERVQVYEGPPSILHSFTLDHVLTTPAVNRGLYRTVRSTVLEQLYRRHQQTREITNEVVEQNIMESRAVVREEQMQEVEAEVGSSSRPQSYAKKSQLTNISVMQPITSETRESSVHQNGLIEAQMEHLFGTPVSRVLQTEVVPPRIGAGNPCLSPHSPRIQNLQSTRIEEPTAEPWFKPVELPAPDEKWREFKYVRNCLEEIWKAKEENGLEKSTTLREVLESKENWNKENMLTLLRIVDKMSLRREVVLKGRGESVMIQPFEMPYVTEKQCALRNVPPTF